jgi:molybdopterin synthase catalytic subunit
MNHRNDSTMVPTNNENDEHDKNIWVDVLEDLPSVQECYEFGAADPSCGAVASFVGITRNTFHSKTVVSLSYEAYNSMARKELRHLCQEVRLKWPDVQRIVAVHKVGLCPVGQASVILVCASPHRGDSLQAVQYLIDELKARVPIWKLERYVDSTEVWKENMEWHKGKAQRVMRPVPNSQDTVLPKSS